MEQPKRGDAKPVKIECLPGTQKMRNQGRDEGWVGILLGLENVGMNPLHVLEGGRFGIDVDRTSHHCVEPTDLIEPEKVIDMMVGVEDSITSTKILPQRLLTKVWRGVDQDDAIMSIGVVEADGRTGSCPGVTGVGRTTDFAIAGNGRDPGRRTGTEHGARQIMHGALLPKVRRSQAVESMVASSWPAAATSAARSRIRPAAGTI